MFQTLDGARGSRACEIYSPQKNQTVSCALKKLVAAKCKNPNQKIKKTNEILPQIGYVRVNNNKIKTWEAICYGYYTTNEFVFVNDIENLGDLDRLRLVIGYLPDEKLMQFLRRDRKNGRNDYPIRVVWNTILAAIVYEHKSTEYLIRELRLNTQLRWLCGIENGIVPPSYVYSRFMKNS